MIYHKTIKKLIIVLGSIICFLFIHMLWKQDVFLGSNWNVSSIKENEIFLRLDVMCLNKAFPILSYKGKEQICCKYLGLNAGLMGYQNQSSGIFEEMQNSREQALILWRNQNTENNKEKVQIVGQTGTSEQKNRIGDIFFEELAARSQVAKEKQEIEVNKKMIDQLKNNTDTSYLIKNFYIVDSTTQIDETVFNVKQLLSKDFTLKKEKKPQILIYHTHASSEAFKDSRAGKKEDTVVGVGSYLTEILTDIYGYQVIHDETEYDKINGKTDRNKAYNNALKGVTKILEENPSIQVIIDIHRDAANNNNHRVTEINGKKTAQIMLFNGLSRNQRGNISYLYNPNLQGNLAFSLQLKIAAMEKYPEFTIRNYLKGYRYNMHLRERFLLIELGNENSTLEEAKNAMEPLAELLNQVLTEEE